MTYRLHSGSTLTRHALGYIATCGSLRSSTNSRLLGQSSNRRPLQGLVGILSSEYIAMELPTPCFILEGLVECRELKRHIARKQNRDKRDVLALRRIDLFVLGIWI